MGAIGWFVLAIISSGIAIYLQRKKKKSQAEMDKLYKRK